MFIALVFLFSFCVGYLIWMLKNTARTSNTEDRELARAFASLQSET